MIKLTSLKLKKSFSYLKSLTIDDGKYICIFSPADTGKSALLLSLLGQSILGTEFMRETLFQTDRIAYIPTMPNHLFSGMKSTLKGELELSWQLIGKEPEAVDKIAIKYNLNHLLDRDPFTLSGGEMVRAAFALNAATKPEIWLLDQIYDWLHPESIANIRTIIAKEISCGHTVVETHSMLPKWSDEYDIIISDTGIRTRRVKNTKTPFHCDPMILKENTSTLCSKMVSEAKNIPILKTINLGFQYPNNGFQLKNIDIDIFHGDIVAITGENGSGKTTLLQCLANLNTKFTGNISINGLHPNARRSWEWAKQAIYCFQNPDDQLYRATVIEEIKTTLAALNKEIPENLDQKLDSFGLSNYLNCEPYHLARPIRRIVCFAATMLSGSPIVLLDEPTSTLDMNLKKIVIEKVKDPQKECGAIIFVSHDNGFIEETATKVIEMRNGMINQ